MNKPAEFEEIVDYCFNDLTPERQKEVSLQILADTGIFDVMRGVMLLKEKHGTKEAVLFYVNQATEKVRADFFAKHFPESEKNGKV